MIAPMSAPAHTATPELPMGTSMMSAPMVCATRTPANPPSRFMTAASARAIRGVSARVDTEVAMAFAASWNPFVYVKPIARATTSATGTQSTGLRTPGRRSPRP